MRRTPRSPSSTPPSPAVTPWRCASADRRGWARGAASVLLALSLAACGTPSAPPAPAPSPPSPATTSATDWPGFVAALQRALGDPAAFAGLLDPQAVAADPGLAQAAEQLRSNLGRFEVTLTATSRTATPAPATVARLGAGLEVRELTVAWRVAGEPVAAEHRIFLTAARRDGALRLAGLGDAPADSTRQEPIWWRHPVRVTNRPGAAVIAAAGTDPDPWLAELDRARGPLAARGLNPPLLVAELPDGPDTFERLLGVPPNSRRDIAAAAWTEGPAVRIVINPAAAAATTGAARSILITHEATHVATGSVRLPAPLWFNEGYADLVALGDQPDAAEQLTTRLAADQRRYGPAAGPPTDAELAAGAPRLAEAYTRAWTAVRVLDRGDRSADRVLQGLRAGRSWPEALAAAGWDERALDAAVAAELSRLAAR
ncbi:hypothetical protein [Enemella evansiae]|uniref:hypothetical protein n=1 Tax=Enemella evansiae TaxID=2016499 RepID=UPI00117C27B3|nr:hypothetical protein [Enemella evansiae]